jgi:hypothetical protein
MAYDFRNSTAMNAVEFLTGVEKSRNIGDNFMDTIIFIDKNEEYVKDESVFLPVDKDESGNVIHDIATLTKNNYAAVAGGRLLTWLTDLFGKAQPYNCYVMRFGPSGGIGSAGAFTDEVAQELNALYEKAKAVAYHKTVLCQDSEYGTLIPEVALFFAQCCARDASLLSAAPYYPCVMQTAGVLNSDPVYSLLRKNAVDAFMCAHLNGERNGSLFMLGDALSGSNASGTPVGDGWGATNLMTPSGQPDPNTPEFVLDDWEDYNLNYGVQQLLEENNIAYFRTIGDGSGSVSPIGGKTLRGEVMRANWVVCFCNYVNKIRVAQLITRKNTRKNSQTYNNILTIMMGTVSRFGDNGGSGALSGVKQSAPDFSKLPVADGDTIVVPNAWSADWIFDLKKIHVYGTLYIVE